VEQHIDDKALLRHAHLAVGRLRLGAFEIDNGGPAKVLVLITYLGGEKKDVFTRGTTDLCLPFVENVKNPS
jgi:hypothetical protein